MSVGALPGLVLILLAAWSLGMLAPGRMFDWLDVTRRLWPLAVLLAAASPLLASTRRSWARGAALVFASTAVTAVVWPYARNHWGPAATAAALALLVAAGCAGLRLAADAATDQPIRRHLALAASAGLLAGLVFEAGSAVLAWYGAALAAAALLPIPFNRVSGGILMLDTRESRTAFVGFYLTLLLTAALYGGLAAWQAVPLALLPMASLAWTGRGTGSFARLMALGGACAIVTSCAPLEPSGGRQLTGKVGFVLEGSSLSLFADQDPALLRIRVFKVVAGAPTDQEGNDHEFPIDAAGGTFTISGVMLGMKEFQLAVLNSAHEILGEGKVQVLVKPGTQTAPSVTITLNTGPRRRDVAMTLFVSLDKPGEVPKITYRDTKPMIDTRCVRCHTGAGGRAPDGGLDLSEFPFTHHDRVMTQDEIVSEMALWMREANPLYRMPPREDPVPAASIGQLDQWRTDGLLEFPMSDELGDLAQKIRVSWRLPSTSEQGVFDMTRAAAGDPFAGECKNLVIGAAYDYELTVLGLNDEAVFTETLNAHVILPDGPMEHEIAIPYTEPDVSVPIIIN